MSLEKTLASKKRRAPTTGGRKPFRITTIGSHRRKHFDEYVSIWQGKRFGEKRFPGISQAEVVDIDIDYESGKTNDDYLAEGVLLLGIGSRIGNPLDEHGSPTEARDKDECTATLMAKELGVDKDPALEKILQFCLVGDSKGGGHPFDIAMMIDSLHKLPVDDKKIMEWVFLALDAKYQEYHQFHSVTASEYKKAVFYDVPAGAGTKVWKMAVIESDEEQINRYARSEHGGNMAVVVQKRSTGNVQIFVDKRNGPRTEIVDDVVRMLRLEEQRLVGQVVTDNWQELALEGLVPGETKWYYHRVARNVLNGSLTTKVVPTLIPLEQKENLSIVEIVQIGLNEKFFEPSREKDCLKGVCGSTRENPCPLYAYGLGRCQSVRLTQRSRERAAGTKK